MRVYPRFIETEEGDIFVIERYFEGRFRLTGTPWITQYDIETGTFYGLTDKGKQGGKEVALHIKPRSPELYRKWFHLHVKRGHHE